MKSERTLFLEREIRKATYKMGFQCFEVTIGCPILAEYGKMDKKRQKWLTYSIENFIISINEHKL